MKSIFSLFCAPHIFTNTLVVKKSSEMWMYTVKFVKVLTLNSLVMLRLKHVNMTFLCPGLNPSTRLGIDLKKNQNIAQIQHCYNISGTKRAQRQLSNIIHPETMNGAGDIGQNGGDLSTFELGYSILFYST